MERLNVLVCCGTGCSAADSERIISALDENIRLHGLEGEVRVCKTGCFGLCGIGPIVSIHPEDVFYSHVGPEDAKEIVTEHFLKGRAVERLLYMHESATSVSLSDLNFYKKQTRRVLTKCGIIDPENIDEYIGADGYSALSRVLFSMTPEEVIKTVKDSGLRGRGGGGFPTGLKWELTRKYEDKIKYVICNADEGDPGAFMDRSILEGDPHAIIEAMTIAGFAIGAQSGIVYVRAEYPIAVQRLKTAISQAREYGLLGNNILDSGFAFDIGIRLGAGAFVCGEETSLISSVEGCRGEPRTRPPFPAEKGLWRKPTLINNVETLANIPLIINDVSAFASVGTEKSKGTKVFALGGKINNTGLVEIPMGTTLREIVYDVGGGIPENKRFKAAQTGGPSGGCIPESLIDTPIDYESLTGIGSMMGSGGLIIMDETTCMVDIARFFLEFTADESCGKCTACRVGTKRLLEMLNKITQGHGEEGDLDDLIRLSEAVKAASLCGLGQTAPNPILSTIRHFRDEYISHIRDKRCSAKVCSALKFFEIVPEKCKTCGICAKNCPVDCISGERGVPYVIDQERCIKCGACFEKCPFDAITN